LAAFLPSSLATRAASFADFAAACAAFLFNLSPIETSLLPILGKRFAILRPLLIARLAADVAAEVSTFFAFAAG
jgi:hypothetical protein